ncbi:titin [Drosophila virilis]|nr:uncharacterized protein LOC6634629 [Drosophila virilis]KRF82575.1 uncharacterized protein Dvir_GJ15857, isoform B [Drosophila virilis]KRF82576.1 uncharacterized protein Dvir_GJ15857, isoform C [Drosophila virilis]
MLETKSISALAFNETPRKRKRETGCAPLPPPLKSEVAAAVAASASSCFTNAAFSSTPKKLVGRRRLLKENESLNPFINQPGLEIKSIADLSVVQQQKEQQQQQQKLPVNPFEVVRQPSKKKKREHACFENPGLNLELPERQFNPYEVVRSVATPTKCFVNEALNLRGSDAPASLNPFEIHRRSDISTAASNPSGVANPALADEPLPTSLKIGLPFTPTLGCRIDFHGMSLAQLTPSKLLAEKLVFSPVLPPAKQSLGAISEESSSMDIGKELDRYQLELENSINEAKLRKNGVVLETKQTELEVVLEQKPSLELEQRIVCTRRHTLTEIMEAPEEPEESVQQESLPPQLAIVEQALPSQPPVVEQEPNHATVEQDLESGDVAYASESEPEEENDIELDFKAPARFVRAYRPAATVAGSKESLHSIASSKSSKSAELQASSAGHGVRNMIRKSIRRLMHPMQQPQQQEQPLESAEKPATQPHNNIMSSIRHSLRRRPHKPQPVEEYTQADISIVDSSERTMKLRSSIPQTEYMRIEQLTNEKKHTLRNSIRRSTRDVLRHVFHKSQDAYATAK